MNCLVDSSTIIQIERGADGSRLQNHTLSIPTIVRAEILEGLHLLDKQEKTEHSLRLLRAFEHISLDTQTAEILSKLLASNIKSGTKKPLADSIILATAIQHNVDALITENKKDFQSKLFRGRVLSLNEL